MAIGPPLGNQNWRGRLTHGRPRIFKTPEELAAVCEEYFEWVMDNPLEEQVLFHYQGAVIPGTKKKMRAMTIKALCLYIGICNDTWIDWRKTREDLKLVIDQVADIIWSQKFEGAAADLLNQNIIARQLGLAEKSDITGGLTVVIGNDDADCG